MEILPDRNYGELTLNINLLTLTPSFRRMPESRDGDKGNIFRCTWMKFMRTVRTVVKEGVVVAWIPACAGMTIRSKGITVSYI